LTTCVKVFIVILAVAAIAFSMLVIQYTAQTINYKALAKENHDWAIQQQQLRNASDAQLGLVQAHLTAINNDQEKKIAELTAKLDEAMTELSAEKNKSLAESHKALSLIGQIAQLNDLFRAADTERKQLQDQLTATRKQSASLQTENFRLAETNQQLEMGNRLADKQIRLLQERNVSLEQMAGKLRSKLQAFAAGTEVPTAADVEGKVALVAGPEAPPIMGRITDTAGALAGISVGTAQGVKTGMELIVYRGGQYLGKLKITKVLPEKSAGTLVQVQGAIRPGDSITDKFQF